MQENDTTLQSYEGHIQQYVDCTTHEVSGHVKSWIDKTLAHIPKNGSILELGSAFGRDAAYIEQQGYKVQRTDATKGFVDLLRQQGYDARVLNAITDDLGSDHSLIIANAVLLHFTPEEMKAVLQKAHDSLVNKGILAFTVKQGEGSEWLEDKLGAPRFFNYWSPEGVSSLLSETGFNVIELSADNVGRNDTHWLQVIAEKSL